MRIAAAGIVLGILFFVFMGFVMEHDYREAQLESLSAPTPASVSADVPAADDYVERSFAVPAHAESLLVNTVSVGVCDTLVVGNANVVIVVEDAYEELWVEVDGERYPAELRRLE